MSLTLFLVLVYEGHYFEAPRLVPYPNALLACGAASTGYGLWRLTYRYGKIEINKVTCDPTEYKIKEDKK